MSCEVRSYNYWAGCKKNENIIKIKTQIFALPGTHNKWAITKNGYIETFMTALTGELFAVLAEHSILITQHDADHFNQDAFLEGVNATQKLDNMNLIHALFATRSRQVLGKLSSNDAASYLSGLLIGSDVIGAIALLKKTLINIDKVTIIGEPRLSEYYQLVLNHLDITTDTDDTSQNCYCWLRSNIQTALYVKD